jgi:hypothetical protein
MEKIPEDSAMQTTHRSVALVGVALTIFGLSLFGMATGVSLAAGAIIASLNLIVLSRTVRRLVAGAGVSWVGVAVIKFIVLMAVTYVLVDRQIVEPLGLGFGFASLPLGILLASALGSEPPQELSDVEQKVERDHA